MSTSMKTKKPTTKKPATKPKATTHSINIEFIEQIADEAIATVMALRALVRQLATELKEARK
jgi:archaellum component FlaD/FlaE